MEKPLFPPGKKGWREGEFRLVLPLGKTLWICADARWGRSPGFG